MAKDLYTLLDVPKTAKAEEIRAAYRRQARRLHPDVNKAPDAEDRFAELQNAYDVLSDPERRAMYDRTGRAGPAPYGGGSGRGHYTWSNVAGTPGSGGFDDEVASAFETFFANRGAGFGRARRGGTGGRAGGSDRRVSTGVPFETAALGGTVRVRPPGSAKTVEVRVPEGVADGATLRLKGQGGPALTPGAPAGDLLVKLEIQPHPVLRRGPGPTADDQQRAGSLDLWLELPLTPAEAMLGAKVELPTPRGPATLTIPPGTSGGVRLRLRGGGLRRGETTGDLYAHTRLRVPDPATLSKTDKAALERLSAKVDPGRGGPGWAG